MGGEGGGGGRGGGRAGGGGGGGGAEVYIRTSYRHKAEDISPSIAWSKERRRKRKRLTILL